MGEGVTLKQKVLFTSTVAATTSTFTTTANILVGEDIFIAMGRNVGANACGCTGIAVSAGAGTFERVDTSCRANTLDVHLARLRVTTQVPSGSVVTITHRSSTAKRGGVMQVVAGLTSAAASASGGNAADNQTGTSSFGSNGSSTAVSASTTGATAVANCLVLMAAGEGGTNTFTEDPGVTKIDEARTTSGSADRGVGLFYKIVKATGVQTASCTANPSAGWAAAIGAFAISSPVNTQNLFPVL